MTGLFAPAVVNATDRQFAQEMLQAVGKTLWVNNRSRYQRCYCGIWQRPGVFLPVHAIYGGRKHNGWALALKAARQLVQKPH